MIDLFFHLLLGTPKGLNARNVVWHGFACEDEISPKFAAALIILTMSICLPMMLGMPDRMPLAPSKELCDLSQIDTMSNVINYDFENVVLNLTALLQNCDAIHSGKVAHLHLALRRHESSKHLSCLNVLLSEFEFLCRMIFCRVNDCSERMMTAETDVLYTTFDEILAQNLPDGTGNKFHQNLGTFLIVTNFMLEF